MSSSDPDGNPMIISGTILGNGFTCATGNSCSIDLPEGNGSAVFHAVDSGGLSSGDFSVNFQFDYTAPSAAADISGTSGTGGWYVSPVTVSSTGSDAISGILAAQVSVDGGGWQDSAMLNDGSYAVVFAALDGAGNEATTSRTLQVDATAPTLNIDLGGLTPGADGWYSSSVPAGLDVSDTLSGLVYARLRVNGGSWTDWAGAPITLGEGTHLLEAEAQDVAGNTSNTSLEVNIRYPEPVPTETPKFNRALPTRTFTPSSTPTSTTTQANEASALPDPTDPQPSPSPTQTQIIVPPLPPEQLGGAQFPQPPSPSLPLLPLAIAAAGGSLALSLGVTRRIVGGSIAEAESISPADAPVEYPGGYSVEEDLARKKAEKQVWAAGQKRLEGQFTPQQDQAGVNLPAAAGVAALGNELDKEEEEWLKKKAAQTKSIASGWLPQDDKALASGQTSTSQTDSGAVGRLGKREAVSHPPATSGPPPGKPLAKPTKPNNSWGGIFSIAAVVTLIFSSILLRAGQNSPRQDVPCGDYYVQAGDTLWGIVSSSDVEGLTIDHVVLANSLNNPDQIMAGQKIRIPCKQELSSLKTPTRVMTATRTLIPSPTRTFTRTITRTRTPSRTMSPTITRWPTHTKTATRTATRTRTPTATVTACYGTYTVKAGDTYSNIASKISRENKGNYAGLNESILREANPSITSVKVGQVLRMPCRYTIQDYFTATVTKTPTYTRTSTRTRTPTKTPTQTRTFTPTRTPTPTRTSTRTKTPTSTPASHSQYTPQYGFYTGPFMNPAISGGGYGWNFGDDLNDDTLWPGAQCGVKRDKRYPCYHPGVDIAPDPNLPGFDLTLTSPIGGTLHFFDKGDNGFGKFVVIDADDGSCQVFAHLESFDTSLVDGMRVEANDPLGEMGGSGSAKGQLHTHWEVRTEMGCERDNQGNFDVIYPKSKEEMNLFFKDPHTYNP